MEKEVNRLVEVTKTTIKRGKKGPQSQFFQGICFPSLKKDKANYKTAGISLPYVIVLEYNYRVVIKYLGTATMGP